MVDTAFFECYPHEFTRNVPRLRKVAEWFKAYAWNAYVPKRYREFESHPLRHLNSDILISDIEISDIRAEFYIRCFS